MASKPTGGFRRFVQTRLGKVALVVISALAVTATFAYVTPLLGIPVFLVVGLALPIFSGVKRPRYLALSGLVVILVVAPVSNIVFSQEIMTPVAAASSSSAFPYGSGGPVLENATVSPFSGGVGTNFTWTVTLFPNRITSNFSATNWSNDSVRLYISTCPGAIIANATYCTKGYPFLELDHNFTSKPADGTVITFNHVIGTNGVWDWQMSLNLQNDTTHNFSGIFLEGDATWNGIEGPVIGGFATVYTALLVDIYITAGLYLGLPFYFLLLLYMLLKNRERRRQDALRRAPGARTRPSPAAGETPGKAGLDGEGSETDEKSEGGEGKALASGEKTCPSCQAVVYPSETKCWKCGASL